MENVFKISKGYKDQADKLLKERGLVKDLERHGEVHFTGAYAADLMMHGDIDIAVVREKAFSIEEVFEIFRELYFKRTFRNYFLGGDWDDPRKGTEFPHGYYIGLKEKINDEKWKIDIWFMNEKEFGDRKKLFQIEDQKITDKEKEWILLFKQYRNDAGLKISGQEIYKAVLEGKCTTLEEFKKYFKLNQAVF